VSVGYGCCLQVFKSCGASLWAGAIRSAEALEVGCGVTTLLLIFVESCKRKAKASKFCRRKTDGHCGKLYGEPI
jgi:hypothetical protein